MPPAVPIYETDQFQLMINLKAAKQIGLTIPQSHPSAEAVIGRLVPHFSLRCVLH
jgi:ABC-type uncharacterized transport system substrate-binding protein